MNRQRGSSAVELLIVLAILVLMMTVTMSATNIVLRRTDLRACAAHIRSILEMANEQGQVRGAFRGVHFFQIDGEWFYAVYEDGNGNGISTDDVNRGIDREVLPPRRLLPESGAAHVGFPPSGIADPDTGRPIAPDARGIQFGRSNFCSFSDYGSCTPGTIYLTDGVSTGAMIRCSGAGGRIRIMYYGLTGSSWSN